MGKDYLNPEWDLVDAKEYAEQTINGKLAFAAVYAVKNGIKDENAKVHIYRKELIRLFQKVHKAKNKDEINETLADVDGLEGYK
jgi:hypothetical protein